MAAYRSARSVCQLVSIAFPLETSHYLGYSKSPNELRPKGDKCSLYKMLLRLLFFGAMGDVVLLSKSQKFGHKLKKQSLLLK